MESSQLLFDHEQIVTNKMKQLYAYYDYYHNKIIKKDDIKKIIKTLLKITMYDIEIRNDTGEDCIDMILKHRMRTVGDLYYLGKLVTVGDLCELAKLIKKTYTYLKYVICVYLH